MPARVPRSRFRRLRRVAGALACVALVLTLSAAIVGHFRYDSFERQWGRLHEIAPTAQSSWTWSYEADSAAVTNSPGKIALYRSRYTSYGAAPSDFGGWESWPCWKHEHASASVVRGQASPWTRWTSWDDFGVLGFEVGKSSKGGIEARFVMIPHWMLALVLAGLTAWLARPDVRRILRLRRGLCVGCGYARAGLANDAPCPECGTAPIARR